MSSKKTSLKGFFAQGKRVGEETEESMVLKKKKAIFTRQYQESYLKYGFISAWRSDLPRPLCVICGARLLNEAMKPSKLLCHLETKHSDIKDKPLEYFERRKGEREGKKELLRAFNALTTNVDALKASFLVADCIAKAEKPFAIVEELILRAPIDICREILREAASKKVGHVPLWPVLFDCAFGI